MEIRELAEAPAEATLIEAPDDLFTRAWLGEASPRQSLFRLGQGFERDI